MAAGSGSILSDFHICFIANREVLFHNRQALLVYKTHPDKEWDLVDCVSFIVKQDHNIREVFTFDQYLVTALAIASDNRNLYSQQSGNIYYEVQNRIKYNLWLDPCFKCIR